jgi:hypothetical protein
MIGLKSDAGDNFKKRASIPLAPCTSRRKYRLEGQGLLRSGEWEKDVGRRRECNLFWLVFKDVSTIF